MTSISLIDFAAQGIKHYAKEGAKDPHLAAAQAIIINHASKGYVTDEDFEAAIEHAEQVVKALKAARNKAK